MGVVAPSMPFLNSMALVARSASIMRFHWPTHTVVGSATLFSISVKVAVFVCGVNFLSSVKELL